MKFKFKFGIKSLFLAALVIAILMLWVRQAREQHALFVRLGSRSALESVDDLPIWKRGIAKIFGEHSVCKIIAADVTVDVKGGVAAVKDLRGLKTLYVRGTDPLSQGYGSITDLAGLEKLVFEHSRLEDVSVLRSLTKLEEFCLYDGTEIQLGGEVFGDLPALKKLHLEKAPFDQLLLEEIGRSGSVEDLWINTSGKVNDLSPVSNLKQLTKLGVNRYKSGWVDLYPILELPNLKELKTSSSYVEDLPVYRELEKRGVAGDYLSRIRRLEVREASHRAHENKLKQLEAELEGLNNLRRLEESKELELILKRLETKLKVK